MPALSKCPHMAARCPHMTSDCKHPDSADCHYITGATSAAASLLSTFSALRADQITPGLAARLTRAHSLLQSLE